jgi:L-ribulose-5-phosphate 3-epimerase
MAIAIMQGRLVPPDDGRIQCFPRARWRDEFALAASAGLDAIEWIYDLYGADVNPIATDEGLAQIEDLSRANNVRVHSLCADYFMDKPLLRASGREIEDRIRT